MKQHSGNSHLTDRDRDIFDFLWRFKIATTRAIHVRFFSNRAPITAYVRLWHLRKHGYIELIAHPRQLHFVWTLSQKGFAQLDFEPEVLNAFGFKTDSLSHDILVNAAMIGEFLPDTPKSVAMFTEQELRRMSPSRYPEWVPKDQSHRPDGYWRIQFQRGPKTIALEVELSRKKSVQYECIAEFYLENPAVDKTLWIVSSPALEKLIINSFLSATKGRDFIHNFVLLNQFLENHWQAPVDFGPYKGYPLSNVLGFSHENLPKMIWTQALLDTRKAPINSESYKKPQLKHFSI